MNSVSNQVVNAAHQAKKPAKSALSDGPRGDSGEFGDMFSSMQMDLQGQDLAAQTGKASPPAEGLASEVLGSLGPHHYQHDSDYERRKPVCFRSLARHG
jgi:hypothetical protein